MMFCMFHNTFSSAFGTHTKSWKLKYEQIWVSRSSQTVGLPYFMTVLSSSFMSVWSAFFFLFFLIWVYISCLVLIIKPKLSLGVGGVVRQKSESLLFLSLKIVISYKVCCFSTPDWFRRVMEGGANKNIQLFGDLIQKSLRV